jgi:hypothetical protein
MQYSMLWGFDDNLLEGQFLLFMRRERRAAIQSRPIDITCLMRENAKTYCKIF